jgi:hypothetical protein
MDRGSSDEAIVGVKPVAVDDAVTYLRVKLSESDSNVGADGWNMLSEPESQNRCCYELSRRNYL